MDKQVAPFYSLGVCKTYKLLHNTLVAKVLQQVFFIVVFTQFRAVAVGILEAELQNQSLVAYFYQVRRYSGCVLRNEYVRHNATAAVYGSAQTGRVTQVFVQFDAVFGEELAVFVTGNPVHFVFAVLAVLVGALDATARWGVITGNGQADGGTVTEVDGLAERGNVEAGKRALSPRDAVRGSPVRSAALFSHQQLYHGTAAAGSQKHPRARAERPACYSTY